LSAWLIFFLAFAQAPDPEAIARQAVDDFKAGKYANARDEFRQALQHFPQNAALWGYLGIAEGNLNNLHDAIADLEKARSLAHADPQILFNLAALYAQTDKPDRALEMYRQGLVLQPDDASANQNYVVLLMNAGQFKQALVPLRKLRALRPDQLSVRVSLIECEMKAGLSQDAHQELQGFLDTPGLTIRDRIKTAGVFMENHVPDATETVLKDTVQRYDDSAEAHGALGKLFLEQTHYEDAVTELGRAVQLAPDTPGYSLALAEALIQWKHFSTALSFLKAIQPKFGTLPEFRYRMGLALYNLNLYPQAIVEFEALTRDHPKMDMAWFFQASCWANTGKLDQAEMYYRKAIALNSHNAAYYTALGQVLRRGDQDRTEEASRAFQSALVIDPNDATAEEGLALCYERMQRPVEAQQLLERVVRQQPELARAHLSLARIYYKLHKSADGDREKAIASQLQAEQSAKEQASTNRQ
jgi:tetratricopeptide (TPR) repeat protein